MKAGAGAGAMLGGEPGEMDGGEEAGGRSGGAEMPGGEAEGGVPAYEMHL